jgi:Holliday junction DNA helicase RuvA
MYHHLCGKLVLKSPASVVVEAGGVGYDLVVPLSTFEKLPAEGCDVRLLTHYHVREDAVRLYGFLTDDERELFRLLIGVSGIGPALAMAVLSGSSVDIVKQAVLSGDAVALRQIRGIGTKTAERIVLELRDVIAKSGLATHKPVPGSADAATRDAVSALVSLGFSRTRAEESVSAARKKCPPGASVEDLVREALKSA